ncbi:MAG: hypothetical protein AMXMBFR49_09220 [Chlorobiota bacterium]
MQKYLLILVAGLFLTSYSQDFIPENVLVYLQYSNNMRDKFLPVWQTTVKNNKISKEIYISYDNSTVSDRIPTPFDSTIFNYDNEGRLISSVSTSPFAGAESAVKVTTTFLYENGLFSGSNDDRGNSMKIERDSKGRITTLESRDNSYNLHCKYHYAGDQLTMIELNPGQEGSVQIVYEENVYIAQDTNSTMTTIGDKYGRVNYVNAHNIGMENQYDSEERLIEMKVYQGGTTEITSFLYSGELLQEIIYTTHEGEIGADLKDTQITKSVKTVVRYE